MISDTFTMARAAVTLISMIVISLQPAWWIALLALIAPIPSFIASMRYGWGGYQLMRRQSPARREMSYYNTLLTTDTYNKEIKLFGLGDSFIPPHPKLAPHFYPPTPAI